MPISDAIYFMISYAGILLIGFGLIQWLSNGFFTKFLKVKASRGKLVLVNVKSKLLHYFVPGRVEGGFLVYDDRESKANKQKEKKRVIIPEGAFYRAIGVSCVNVDEESNSVILPGGSAVAGYDAIKFSNLYTRALYKPSVAPEDKTKILLVVTLVICVIIIFGVIALYTKLVAVNDAVALLNQVGGVTGGNVP